MKIPRRKFLQLSAGATAMPVLSRVAFGQAFPPRVIRIVVPFPPGGTVDPIARMAQPGLQQRLGATVVIENKPGASGAVGTGLVAKSPPDGSTWVFVFDTHAANPFLQNLPFDTEKDLDPVLLIGTAPNVLSTHTDSPFKSLADVLAAAKAKPDTITYASVGAGSGGHLTAVLLSERAGVRLVHVPYRGGGPAMNDAIAGHVDLIIVSAAASVPQIQGGKIRGLLQTGKARIAALPNVPTATESGFPGFEWYAWWGVFAPAHTSKPIVERFSTALAESLREGAISRQLSENLQITMLLAGPDEEREFLSDQMKLLGPLIREHGIVAVE
jgi:tripartite-type tricarboxylate transporter receptor subunit TctC